jgi:hypothetical protein
MEDIDKYLERNLKKGYTKESLKWALVKQGYPKKLIERSFKKFEKNDRDIPKEKPTIKHEIISQEGEKTVTVYNPRSFWKRLFGF